LRPTGLDRLLLPGKALLLLSWWISMQRNGRATAAEGDAEGAFPPAAVALPFVAIQW
jgi:hypothetical protein